MRQRPHDPRPADRHDVRRDPHARAALLPPLLRHERTVQRPSVTDPGPSLLRRSVRGLQPIWRADRDLAKLLHVPWRRQLILRASWLALRVAMVAIALIAAGIICLYLSEAVVHGWWQGTLDGLGVGFIIGALVDVLAVFTLTQSVDAARELQQVSVSLRAPRRVEEAAAEPDAHWPSAETTGHGETPQAPGNR